MQGETQPAMALANLLTVARVARGMTIEDAASAAQIPVSLLGTAERGLVPLSATQLRQFASAVGGDFETLLSAAKGFQSALWSEDRPKLVATEIDGDVRMISAIPPEVLFTEYREGWFAGSSGRDDPGDMSPEWSKGHEDGRVAMEAALHAKRTELDIDYGVGKAGSVE